MLLLNSGRLVSIFYLNVFILCIQGNSTFPDLPPNGQNNSTFKSMINVETDNKAPEYEIVHLRILSKRSADDQNVIRVHLTAFGKDIHLRLERKEEFSDKSQEPKLFIASITDKGVQLTEMVEEDDDPGIPYVDVDQMAAVTIRHGPDGELLMDGVIGDDLVIKPAPSDVYKGDYNVYDRNSSEVESNLHGYSTSAPIKGAHMVFRRAMRMKSAYKEVLDGVTRNFDYSDDRRYHKQPLHAFPEVLLMVDYDTYQMHVSDGFNDAQIKRYYVSFFNGVDLRFKILSDPQISLILSQIVIFKNRDDTPFVKNNLRRNILLHSQNALTDFARHMYSYGEGYQKVDLAILVTQFDMCSYQYFMCDSLVAGISSLRGACHVTPWNKLWHGVAIVQDVGGFDGILTAAHEIGHLLGSAHDGDSTEYPSNCTGEEGYIMTHQTTSLRIFQWSECSIKQFRSFFSSGNALCLFNQPTYCNELEGSELPGVVLSLDQQCKRILGTKASASDSRVCQALHCFRPQKLLDSNLKIELPPAAEGSYCGTDHHCRNGNCVSKYLTYSPRWNMDVTRDSLENIKSTTTEKPTITDRACTGNKDEFCDSYFSTIERREACRNSRVREACCFSHNMLCKVWYL